MMMQFVDTVDVGMILFNRLLFDFCFCYSCFHILCISVSINTPIEIKYIAYEHWNS